MTPQAIAWGRYLHLLLSGFGVDLPGWRVHGYRMVKVRSDPRMLDVMQAAPRLAGVPILITMPRLLHCHGRLVAATDWRQKEYARPCL